MPAVHFRRRERCCGDLSDDSVLRDRSSEPPTDADGVMSAEGLLDDPALFFPRWGNCNDGEGSQGSRLITVREPSPLPTTAISTQSIAKTTHMRKIETIEAKLKKRGEGGINEEQQSKLDAKSKVLSELRAIEKDLTPTLGRKRPRTNGAATTTTTTVRLRENILVRPVFKE